MMGSPLRRSLILALAVGCGGTSPPGPAAEPIEPPTRTAAEDRGIRTMLLAVAEAQLCGRLEGSFVALPDEDVASGPAAGASPAAGRLWIEHCSVTQRGGRLAMRLSGRGWTWVEQSSVGPVGTSYTVRGHLRFSTTIELLGEIDVAYVQERGLVSVWLTPRQAADAVVTPTGAVRVEPDGGWSAFIGALGGAFGASVEERALPIIEEEGSHRMAERLTSGFTFTVDLCSGQADTMVGALGNGEVPERPYPPDGTRWLANQRVRLRAGGIDASGPFEGGSAPLRVDVDMEEGGDLEVRAFCLDEAREIVGAFLDGRQDRPPRPRARQRFGLGSPGFLELDGSDCPLVLITTPRATDAPSPIVFRYRVVDTGATATALVHCN